MRIPLSTYRIQFTPEFGFQEARNILNYLSSLGISEIYASPVFQARPGSTHGYDVVDSTHLNPELGTPSEFRILMEGIRQLRMGWIQDIVPNHMAYHPSNTALMDIFEQGPASPFFRHFDIDWNHPDPQLKNRVIAPFLGKPLNKALRDSEIQLCFSERGFYIQYYSFQLPLFWKSYGTLLKYAGRVGDRESKRTLKSLIPLFRSKHQDPGTFPEVKKKIWEVFQSHPSVRQSLLKMLKDYNAESVQEKSLLTSVLNEQKFLLNHWEVSNRKINYRRFFTINELISLKAEDQEVFRHTHRFIFAQSKKWKWAGLRVDHIDGLLDPSGYIQNLREKIGHGYLVVEKILERDETLPMDWEVQGTTGYDVLNAINQLFCDSSKEKPFDLVYFRFTGMKHGVDQLIYDHKRQIIQKYMKGDVENLLRLFLCLYQDNLIRGKKNQKRIHAALTEAIACFPVYRTYGEEKTGATVPDRFYIDQAVKKAVRKKPNLRRELEVLKNVLKLDFPKGLSPAGRKQWAYWVMRFQQLTGPLMAKGFEDTTLYVYNRLLSLNEVGGYPERFGMTVEAWNRFCQIRTVHWPLGMNATATHDTKRGEDARARINVLSEIPEEWEKKLLLWHHMNRNQKIKVDRKEVPGKNEEYLLYQSLLGALPNEGRADKAFIERLTQFMIKAGREAKIRTDWIHVNVSYENALTRFIQNIMTDSQDNRFLKDLKRFHRRILFFGILNSLSQTLLKVTAPGVPDFYQGTDLWDLSFVDPDNRRPVDYNLRKRALGELIRKYQIREKGFFADLWKNREDGRIKMFTIYRSLHFRRAHRKVFESGVYVPLKVAGKKRDHIVAFARVCGSSWVVCVVPRFFTGLVKAPQAPLGPGVWGDTRILHPSSGPGEWQEIFTRRSIFWKKDLPIGDFLKAFPVAILHGEEVK